MPKLIKSTKLKSVAKTGKILNKFSIIKLIIVYRKVN